MTVRDPTSKLIRAFLPALAIDIFLHQTFEIRGFGDRLENLSICLLTFISIMKQLRNNLPEVSRLTFSDKFMLAQSIISLMPLMEV